MIKHTAKPKGSILAALDVGTSKVACIIGRVIDDVGSVEVLGVGHVASKGVKAGVIVDIYAAEDSIRRAVHAAESMASLEMRGYPLRDVVLAVPSLYTSAKIVPVDVSMMGQTVGSPDLRRAMAKAQAACKGDGRQIVHAIPAAYMVDGHKGIEDPKGMRAGQLRVDAHIVSCETAALANMLRCAEKNHLDVETLCIPSYAAGLACLVEDELQLGATVIDIGAGVTSYALFRDGAMVHTGAVPVGGEHVTADVAQGLNTARHHAERIKILYGSVLGAGESSELIDVPQMGEEEDGIANHVPHAKLVAIMQPRLEEMLELVRNRIDDSGLGALDGRRVVLTGGACQTPGFRDLAARVLNRQVRLGRPIYLPGLPDVASGPGFAATAGLLQYACARTDERPQSASRLDAAASIASGSIIARVREWFKENW